MQVSKQSEARRKNNMKKFLVLGFTTAALVANLSSLGADRPARAAVEHAVAVKEVSGNAEYAYDSTGWKPLSAGKVLHAGAFVRTGSDARVILSMEEQGSFVRVGPSSRLELAKAAPALEREATPAPAQASAETKTEPRQTIIPVIHKGSYSLAALH
jgi:hypothetical protein